jgi:electron transport complex protein RnfG
MKNLALLSVIFLSMSAHAETVMELKTFLKEELSGSTAMSKETFPLTAEQKKALTKIAANATDDSFVFYYAKSAKAAIEKACTVVPQQGKEGPMTIGICFDPNGFVKKVSILEFSEERGRPVKDQTFLKQFSGQKVSAAFEVGKDIDAISGATISSKAVSEAVRKAAFAFKTFIKK